MKVGFTDRKLLYSYSRVVALPLALMSVFLTLGASLASGRELLFFLIVLAVMLLPYVVMLVRANRFQKTSLVVGGTPVTVRVGDIMKEESGFLNVIAFNEFFDTHVGDGVISPATLNGKLLESMSACEIDGLDESIRSDPRLSKAIVEYDVRRRSRWGKTNRYRLGTTHRHGSWLITAMTRFNENDNAYLSAADYVAFLLNFWREVSIEFEGRAVRVPLLGSGRTRFEDRRLEEEELLNLMLLTLKHCPYPFPTDMRIELLVTEECMKKLDLYHIGYGICD